MKNKTVIITAIVWVALFALVFDAAGREARGVTMDEAMDRPLVTSTDEAAIRAIFDRYARCFADGDAEAWIALWDPEGVQLPPGCPMCVGRDAIWAANSGGIKDKSVIWSMNISTQEVISFPKEGYALARGVYDWTRTPKAGGETTKYDGKFMTIFRRQDDGSWLIFRDSFNSNS